MGLKSRLFGSQNKASPQTVGHALFMLVLEADRDEAKFLHSALHPESDEDFSEEEVTILREMNMLRLMAVDWGVFQVLGRTPLKEAVLNELWSEHAKLLAIDPTYREHTKDLDDRIGAYAADLNQPWSPSAPFAGIGRSFALVCGRPGDVACADIGATTFRNTVVSVSRVLYDAKMSTQLLVRS